MGSVSDRGAFLDKVTFNSAESSSPFPAGGEVEEEDGDVSSSNCLNLSVISSIFNLLFSGRGGNISS